MRIGIITAMPEETGAIIKAIGGTKIVSSGRTRRYRCQVVGHEILLVEGGMGPANAVAATEALLREGGADLLLSAGFCGGIRPGLTVGDAVLAAGLAVVSADGVQDVPVMVPETVSRFITGCPVGGVRLVSGLFATTQVIMRKEQLARLLPADAPYPVVEMESGAIAGIAAAHSLPFIGLRTVSDPHDEELGFSLDEFCDDRMCIRIPRVLLTIARKPRIIPQLIRLARNSRTAAESLSRVMPELLAVL
jgi:adenosylhomocysteine nucleosidase